MQDANLLSDSRRQTTVTQFLGTPKDGKRADTSQPNSISSHRLSHETTLIDTTQTQNPTDNDLKTWTQFFHKDEKISSDTDLISRSDLSPKSLGLTVVHNRETAQPDNKSTDISHIDTQTLISLEITRQNLSENSFGNTLTHTSKTKPSLEALIPVNLKAQNQDRHQLDLITAQLNAVEMPNTQAMPETAPAQSTALLDANIAQWLNQDRSTPHDELQPPRFLNQEPYTSLNSDLNTQISPLASGTLASGTLATETFATTVLPAHAIIDTETLSLNDVIDHSSAPISDRASDIIDQKLAAQGITPQTADNITADMATANIIAANSAQAKVPQILRGEMAGQLETSLFSIGGSTSLTSSPHIAAPLTINSNTIMAGPNTVTIVSEALLRAKETSKGVTVQLDPPEMGRVYIDFIFESDRPVTVIIKTETADAQHMLRERSEEFLAMLKENGLEDANLSFEFHDGGESEGFHNTSTAHAPRTLSSGDDMSDPTFKPRAVYSRHALYSEGLDLRL